MNLFLLMSDRRLFCVVALLTLVISLTTYNATGQQKQKYYNEENTPKFGSFVGKRVCLVGTFESCKEGPVLWLNDKDNSTLVIKFDADLLRGMKVRMMHGELKKMGEEMNDFVQRYQNGHYYKVTGTLGYHPLVPGHSARPGGFAQGEPPYYFLPIESLKIVPCDKSDSIKANKLK
jgi:hypothetical protein